MEGFNKSDKLMVVVVVQGPKYLRGKGWLGGTLSVHRGIYYILHFFDVFVFS